MIIAITKGFSLAQYHACNERSALGPILQLGKHVGRQTNLCSVSAGIQMAWYGDGGGFAVRRVPVLPSLQCWP